MKNSLILLILMVPSFSYAVDDSKTANKEPALPTQQENAKPAVQKSRWGVAGSPRYYSMYNGNNVTTFGSTGNLESPKSQWVGIEILGYFLLGQDWQVGLGLGGTGYSDDNAINTATYSQGYFGLWLGKQFQLSSPFDVEVGSLVALGFAQTELISTGASGRTVEKSFLLEPKLTLAYRMSPLLKMGVSGSYLEPAAYTQSIRGQNLTGNAHITVRGPSAGIEFIFSPE